jgi:DNA polymerase-3 subunit gamma/tau
MDVLEIDAASNNGVDNVRDLRDDAVYAPSQVKKRVYIIDEVHMLSISAFNALLKLIEEPPEHLLFILATTELHKVPATVLSRCQRFSFRRISQEDIAARLQYVAYQENIDLDDAAARVLARLADGGMRDGLSLLDQCASAVSGELTADKVYACLGIAGAQECGKLMQCIADRDAGKALAMLNRFYADGKDMGALLDELACLTRDFMVLKTAARQGISMLSGVAPDDETLALSERFSSGELTRMMGLIQQTAAGFSRSASRRLDTELCILSMCLPELELNPESLNARLTRIEDQLRSGSICLQPASAAPISDDRDEFLPTPDDRDAPPEPDVPVLDEAPAGFWQDLAAQMRREMKPPVSGFFSSTQNSSIGCVLRGDKLVLVCDSTFIMETINKPEILELASRKAAALLRRPVQVSVTDRTSEKTNSDQMDKLLQFGRAHSNIINIK